MPGMFWEEAVVTTVYLLNRSLRSNLEGRTPYEPWHDNKPAIHHLRTFECVVYSKVTWPDLAKFDEHGRKGIFLGYKEGSKAYRVYDPVEGRVHVSHNTVFDENTFWNWDTDGDEEQNMEPFTVEFTYVEMILDEAGLDDCNPYHTSMESRLHLSKTGDTPRVDATLYQSLIGSLRYLGNTRPDLAYLVGYVSRFMEEPREEHLKAVKRILRYITGTKHWGVTYTPNEMGT
jgi:hypothetical protein